MTTGTSGARPSEVLWPAVVGGAFFGPAVQVLEVLGPGGSWVWRDVLVRSALFAVAMGLVVAVQLRFSAAARERSGVERAVSDGVLPAGADRDLLHRLTAERRRLRTTRSGAPVVALSLAALVAVLTLRPEGPGGVGWVCVAGLVLGGGLVAARSHRRLRTAERLRGELEERLAQV